MTAAQQMRLEGFNALLAQRGVLLKVLPTEASSFTALVEPIQPLGERFQSEREMSRVHVLRTAIASLNLKRGQVLKQYDGSEAVATQRITAIEDNRANIVVVLTCESCED
jgi:hypothetical protein